MAWNERRNGRRALVRYGKIWLGGKWWNWDEETEELVDRERIVGKIGRGKSELDRRVEVIGDDEIRGKEGK